MYEKCAQNVWAGLTTQKLQFSTILGGSYRSNGRYPQSETAMVWQIQLQNGWSKWKVCTYPVKLRNYKVFARTAQK